MIDPTRVFRAFTYRTGASWYSFLHPLTKVLAFAMLLLAPLAFQSVGGELLIVAIIAPIVAASRTGRGTLDVIMGSWAFLVVIIALNYVLTRNIGLSVAMGLRLIIMLVLSACFFATTDVIEIADLMTRLRLPYYISFSFVLALRFVPVLADDAQDISAAQQSRGLELHRGNVLKRIMKLLPILTPLIITAIRRSGQLAEALESRAFGSAPRRTTYLEYSMSWRDLTVLAYTGLALFLIFLLRPYLN